MDPSTKKLLVYWSLGGGGALLTFAFNIYCIYLKKP